LLCRSRGDAEMPPVKLNFASGGFSIALRRDWLDSNPLTKALLEDESRAWKTVGIALTIKMEKAAR
jgi:hypothetical protein